MALVSLSFESAQGEHVALLVEVQAHGKDARTVEKECEMIVKHALLETEGDAAERLDGTLKEMNGLIKGLLLSGGIDDIHMIIAIMDGDRTLHVSHAGRAEAYLVRKGIASQITEYSGKPTPAFVHIASGGLEKTDVVVLTTQRLLRTLTPAQLAALTHGNSTVIDSVLRALETEGEHAAVATITFPNKHDEEVEETPVRSRGTLPSRRRNGSASGMRGMLPSSMPAIPMPSIESLAKIPAILAGLVRMGGNGGRAVRRASGSLALGGRFGAIKNAFNGFLRDLTDPKRKKRAHLLLLATAVATLLVVWALVNVFTTSQRSKSRAELETLVEQINEQVQTAENRRIIGDTDAANAILDRAEEQAKQVMDNEAGLFRVEALDLLERIRSKKEEINNIVRLSPRLLANLGAKSPDILAQGLIGRGDGEFIAYDRQDLYRVLLNSVEDPRRLSEDVLILDGTNLERFQTLAFLMTGNSVVEFQNGQAISMKTDDPRGWTSGIAVDSYLRFLYILSPGQKEAGKCQICKYERLNGTYGVPVEYNVNADLTDAVDMSIDGNVYVLKEGGTILKLFRGETQPFVIRSAPEGILNEATRLFKVVDRNFYALDPVNARVIVFSDGGPTGESSYLKQYVLEGDQVGELKDLYVDRDETTLYVMDEKRIYAIDLTAAR